MWSYGDKDRVQSKVIRNRAMDLRDTKLYVGKFGRNIKKKKLNLTCTIWKRNLFSHTEGVREQGD